TLIGLLVLQLTRRREAESHAHRSQTLLQASYDRIRDLAGRLLLAQEAERSRIARELHDDIGQQLALLAIDLELTAGAGGDVNSEAETLITESLSRVRSISKSVHGLSHRLHPETLHLIGLPAALRALRDEFARPHLAIRFDSSKAPDNLPHDVSLALY